MYSIDQIAEELDTQHYTADEGIQSWRGLELPSACRLFKTDTDTLLEALRIVANRYPVRRGERRCTSCGMPIRFRKNRVPIDREGINHFKTCPNRDAHRRTP